MSRGELFELAAAMVLYSGYFGGMYLLFRDSVMALGRQVSVRHRLHTEKKHVQSMNPLMQHLHVLLSATMQQPRSPAFFLAGCAALFLILFGVSFRSFRGASAFLISSGGAAVPYLLLRVRLETIRRRGSGEGEKVVSELLRQYRICNRNVYQSLERVIPELNDCKVCRRLFHRMLLRLRNTGSSLEIREVVGVFSYAVGTNWSHMLAGCLRLSAEKGYDVSLGLEDILMQIRRARSRAEERKRMNSEAMRLTLFMVPLLYCATVMLSVYYLEVPLMQFLKNQLGTPEGVFMFLLIGFLFLLNIVLLEIVNNQKLDY